jgi:N-dimethylarginine dimethylaminohydrolase
MLNRDAFPRERIEAWAPRVHAHGYDLPVADHSPGEMRTPSKRSRILMCAPTHFEVSYVINPWMDGNQHAIQPARALAQWNALREVLGRHATIEAIAPAAGLPDMPFTANAGLVRGGLYVPSRFRHAERRGEETHFTRWFRERGFEVRALSENLAFEGAGDALFDRGAQYLWMGHGHRTDLAAAAELAGIFDLEVIPLRLADARFYHLDTCFCPLPRGILLWYPQAFDADSRAVIESRIAPSRRIAVEEKDALAFACNAVSIGSAVVLNRASGKLKQSLDDAGFTVIETALDEFLKAGGSAKCLTLRLDEMGVG